MTGNPFPNVFSFDDLGPEDAVCYYLRHVLANDAILRNLFGADKIQVVPTLDGLDWTNPPQLQIGYDAATEEDSFPTSTDSREVRLIIRIRHDWQTWAPIASGEPRGSGLPEWPFDDMTPSLSTLENHILTLVKNKRHLATVINGQQGNLVSDGPGIGPFAPAGMDEPREGDGFAFRRDCRVSYQVKIDHTTGRLVDVKRLLAA